MTNEEKLKILAACFFDVVTRYDIWDSAPVFENGDLKNSARQYLVNKIELTYPGSDASGLDVDHLRDLFCEAFRYLCEEFYPGETNPFSEYEEVEKVFLDDLCALLTSRARNRDNQLFLREEMLGRLFSTAQRMMNTAFEHQPEPMWTIERMVTEVNTHITEYVVSVVSGIPNPPFTNQEIIDGYHAMMLSMIEKRDVKPESVTTPEIFATIINNRITAHSSPSGSDPLTNIGFP